MNAYETAYSRAVWRDLSHFGRFSVGGTDAAHLLHHLTTNDVKKLQVGQGVDAVLVNNKARVLDLLSIFRRDTDFLVITSPNRRAMFEAHARKFIIYRQDVKIADISDRSGMSGIFGANPARVLDSMGLETTEHEINRMQRIVISDAEIEIAHTARLPMKGCFLWSDNRAELLHHLQRCDVPQCDNETYNILRIEAGLPVTGLELTEDYNPWEAGLTTAISLHKGCYNGQEIIARLNTYQKIKRHLCGVQLQRMVGEPPVKLMHEGREVGVLTSHAQSPQHGAIGLAYVRNDFVKSGTQLQLSGAENTPCATVCELPFVSA